MKNTRYLIASCAVALLASGCGSGGGASSSSAGSTIPTAAIQITATNGQQVARSSNSSSKSAAATGASGATVAAVMVQPRAPRRSVLDIALSQINHVQSIQIPAVPVSVVGVSITGFPITFGCGAFANTNNSGAAGSTALNSTNGTMALDIQGTMNNATAPPTIATITAFSITYSNCQHLPVAGVTTTNNGVITLNINSSTGGVLNATTGKYVGAAGNPKIQSIGMSMMNFTNVDAMVGMTSVTTTMNGGFTIGTSDDGTVLTSNMSGTSLSETSSVDGAFSLTNFSITDTQDSPVLPLASLTGNYTYSVNMTLNSTALGGGITIATPTPFSGNLNSNGGNPNTGQMVISGAKGSSLTLTANAPIAPATTGTVTISVNDGTAAVQPVLNNTLAWTAL